MGISHLAISTFRIQTSSSLLSAIRLTTSSRLLEKYTGVNNVLRFYSKNADESWSWTL